MATPSVTLVRPTALAQMVPVLCTPFVCVFLRDVCTYVCMQCVCACILRECGVVWGVYLVACVTRM